MMKKTGPADFSVRYTWCEGSVPPPYHYEYTIRVGPGPVGEIVFCPDYPAQDTPVWTEAFDVGGEALDALHALMEERGVFGGSWTEVEDAPIGGSLEWLEATAGDERFRVPSAIEESERIEEVYAAVRALVPEAIWTKLTSQREQYEQSYDEA